MNPKTTDRIFIKTIDFIQIYFEIVGLTQIHINTEYENNRLNNKEIVSLLFEEGGLKNENGYEF